jgi:hypothetical protein
MKQTAVEWLEQKLKANPFRIENDKLWNQAKEMEKEQIMKARQDIFHTGNLTAEQYYNETFKS